MSPLRAVASGLLAGAIGSLIQSAFFAASKGLAPSPPKDAFSPPEPEQRSESETQTVARRVVEGLAQRRIKHKSLGQLVHVAFGAAWGALYGLVNGSRAGKRAAVGAPVFATAVWAASDNVILPAFKLAGPASAYPLKTHAYAVLAHWVYGAAVWGAFEALRPGTWRRPNRLARGARILRRLPQRLRLPEVRALLHA